MATVTHCGFCWDSILEHIDEKIEPPHFHTIFTAKPATIQNISSSNYNNSNNNNDSGNRNSNSDNSMDSSSSSSASSDSSSSSIITVSHTDKYPLFITWKKKATNSSKEWRLRGCIGTFTARELLRGLREYAIHSAFKDTRFSPITATEIPLLSVDVSLLLHFESNLQWNDWIIGKHGIQIDFSDPKNTDITYSATYLPDVPPEQGWNHEKTVEELVYKAGYRGTFNAKLKQSIQLTRYQTSKASLSYTEYVNLKKQLAKQHNLLTGNNNNNSSSATTSSSSISIFTNFARKVLKSGNNNSSNSNDNSSSNNNNNSAKSNSKKQKTAINSNKNKSTTSSNNMIEESDEDENSSDV